MNLAATVCPAEVLDILTFEKIVDFLSWPYEDDEDHPILSYRAVEDAVFSPWCSHSLARNPRVPAEGLARVGVFR